MRPLKAEATKQRPRSSVLGWQTRAFVHLKEQKNSETEHWSENWGKCLLVKSGFTSSNSWCLNLMWVESCLRWVRELKIVSSEETRLDVLRHRNDVSTELGWWETILTSTDEHVEEQQKRKKKSAKEKFETFFFLERVKIFGLHSKGESWIPHFWRKTILNGCHVLINSILSGPEARKIIVL